MSKLKLKPIKGTIIAEVEEQSEKTKDGIITEREKKLNGRAKILALHEDITQVSVGDKILYKEFAGVETTFEGKEYLFLKEDDLIAVI